MALLSSHSNLIQNVIQLPDFQQQQKGAEIINFMYKKHI
jgi:hypothetical protein